MDSKKTVKILSFDGGGTRGYLQCKFLQRFCQQANITDLSKEFDVIAGSSVGAINSVAFASGMTPETMLQFFREKTPWIFTIRSAQDVALLSNNASTPSNKPNALQRVSMLLASDPFYKSVSEHSNYGNVRLKTEITNIFGDRLLSSLEPAVLITSHNYSRGYPISFTNVDYAPIKHKAENIKIVDALMSSTSAPIYFPSYPIQLSADTEEQADNLIDGGLFQNNPTILAYTMARNLFPNAKRYCVLSLSTGTGAISEIPEEAEGSTTETAIKKYLNLLDIAMSNGEITSNIFFKGLSLCPDINVFYYRFKFKLDKNRDTNLDTSTTEFFDYLDEAVINKYNEDIYEISAFIDRLADNEGAY